jgi:molybdate/tungstate transport system ATP-binding protein
LVDVDLAVGTFRLKSITLDVGQQEYLIVIGRTASGKTTLLKMIAGAYRPSSGKILIGGFDITAAPPERRNVAYVSQIFSSFDPMNVQGNIEFGLKARGIPRSKRDELVRGISKDLDIEHLLHRAPATLSGGEQQRVSLARALVTKPRVLLLDEPLSMIDPETKGSIIRLLKAIPEKYKIPVVHVTHEWDEAYALADRVAVIHQGSMVEVGTPEQIFNSPRSYLTAKLVGFYDMHKGEATVTLSGSVVKLGNGLELRSHMSVGGPVYACIRSERLKLGADEGTINCFEGSVVEVFRERFWFRIIIKIAALEFAALVGSSPAKGDTVKVTIPEDSVYLIAREPDRL